MRQSMTSMKDFFGAKDEDGMFTCPFKACGRKFPSEAQMKKHIERRHASKDKPIG